MTRRDDHYTSFVEHPRYGKRPILTGLNPPECPGTTFFHWHSPKTCRIAGTALKADTTRQLKATYQVSHYFDVERICKSCGRGFIFFAQEQKHWYEELGFGLDADCKRCCACRKKLQFIARKRKRYEELFHDSARGLDEDRELIDCCLTLIEEAVFHPRQTEHVRMLLNRMPAERRSDSVVVEFTQRLHDIEKRTSEQDSSV
jgi:hypothetical protein